MRRLSILIIGLILPIFVFSQNDSLKRIYKGDFLIKITPTNLIDPFLPNIEVGISYFLKDNLGLQFKFGSKYDILNPDDIYKTSGFKCSLEGQFFINTRTYFSLENGTSKNTYSDEMIYLLSELDENEITDSYYVTEENIYICPEFGLVRYLTNRILLDFYVGLGIQRIKRVVYDLEFDKSLGHVDATLNESLIESSYIERNDYGAKISLGLSICYRF